MDIIMARISVVQLRHDSGVLPKLKGLNVSFKAYGIMQTYKTKRLPAIQLPEYIYNIYNILL